MPKTYKDYFNQNVLTIPDTFIDVKTGDHQNVSPKILEEIKYHSENNTLNHLIFSALNEFFHKNHIPQTPQQGANDVLTELLEIKRMLHLGKATQTENQQIPLKKPAVSMEMNIKEIEDVLEAFGG